MLRWKSCPGCTQHDVDDHTIIEKAQQGLEKLPTKIYDGAFTGDELRFEGAEFYLALTEFHGRYLEHTAEEERVTQILLWKHFTDEELAAQRGKILAKNPPETLLTWFKVNNRKQSAGLRCALQIGGIYV